MWEVRRDLKNIVYGFLEPGGGTKICGEGGGGGECRIKTGRGHMTYFSVFQTTNIGLTRSNASSTGED